MKPTQRNFPYSWKHIPTGKTGVKRVIIISVNPTETLLRNINKWNIDGNGEWLYWTEAIGCPTPIDSFIL